MAIRQEGNTYYGLSTDTKPTGAVLNGREFREMDTGKKYLFDEENGEWLEQPEEGGGGGGSSFLVIGATYDENEDKITLDKTWNEIHNALIARTAIGQIFINFGGPDNAVQILTLTGCVYEDEMFEVSTDGTTFRCWNADDYPSDPMPEPGPQ